MGPLHSIPRIASAVLLAMVVSGCHSLNEPIATSGFPLKERWHFEVDSEVATAPGVGNGKLVVRTDNRVYALNARTGTLLWDTSVPSSPLSYPTSPLVGNDLVIIGHQGGVEALDAVTGNIVWVSQSTSCAGTDVIPAVFGQTMIYVVHYHCDVRAYDRATGTVMWDVDLPGSRSGADLFLEQDKVYLVITGSIVQVRDAATGKLLMENENQISRFAAYQSGVLYGFKEDRLVAFDPRTNRVLWSSQAARVGEYSPLLDGNRVLVPPKRGQPMAFDAKTGQRLWIATTDEDTFQTPVVLGNTVYIRGIFSGKIYALSIQDGSEIGQLLTGNRPVISDLSYTWQPVIAEGLLIVPMGKRVYAYGD
jgi:outer membrane protein assembly factor BamB